MECFQGMLSRNALQEKTSDDVQHFGGPQSTLSGYSKFWRPSPREIDRAEKAINTFCDNINGYGDNIV